MDSNYEYIKVIDKTISDLIELRNFLIKDNINKRIFELQPRYDKLQVDNNRNLQDYYHLYKIT